MTPPLAKKAGLWEFLNKPVDFNGKLNQKPILGSHKTWRGVISGLMVGILVTYLQSWLFQFINIQKISLINYWEVNLIAFGFLMSGGAIMGDLISAFFKRRLNLRPGQKFIPFDQTNYVLGSALFLTPFFKIDMVIWLILFPLTFVLHIVFNRFGYHLKLHGAKW
jgi:CDP-2,3-bis-(O-geranylgeranyl)-sn-glycerol synthase